MTRALIIGGGIAGPATALALHKAGIDATVYEAHPAGADGVGAFLTIAPNGIAALHLLGVDVPAGVPTPAITLRSSTGKRLGDSPLGATARTIRRSDLYGALRDAALARGIGVEHGKRLVAAEDGVRAAFADGSEAAGDVLIGADGVHSAVRRIIDPAAPAPVPVGLVGTGGYASGVPLDTGFEMIFGRRAFFGHVTAPGEEVWWFANVPARDAAQPLLELFADDAGPATELIRATPHVLPASPMHTVPHLPAWHRGRMVVVGDAAHAPSPSSGQGASLAVEDALVLAKCLRDDADPDAAFARFEAARRERVERIIKWAARINNSKAPGPVGRVVRDAMLPAFLKLGAGGKAQRQMHSYRVEWA